LARAYRFAHARGIRVIARIPCFHDPLAQKKASRLSIMGNWGGPYRNQWIDPMNPEAQEYVMELTQEAIDAGADEIQLDYIRFPVTGEGIEHTKLPAPKDRSNLIRDFVHRVRELAHKNKVMLSLDIFGVTATGDQSDIDKLGQDIATIGGEADALSPMVYPSHYANGYHGFAEPGQHPEIIGIGTRAAIAKLKAAHHNTTVIRSWLQAFDWKAPNYGPKYLLDEIKSAESSGGVGWLMWNPGNDYWAAWRALPPAAAAAASR
jgi:hypothetical protein